MFKPGFGRLRGVLVAVLICFALPLLLVFTLVSVPWLSPSVLLVPVVVIPVSLMWRRQTIRDRAEEADSSAHQS